VASDPARAIDSVASSVADGGDVDWERSSAGLPDRERRLISHLRIVDAVSQVYRSLPGSDPYSDNEQPAAPDPAGPRWGRLVLLDRIGRGASSDVFRAWDADLQREVALKLLVDDGIAADEAANARMLREARRIARVRHPHIVHVYGVERHEGRVGLWMELIRGRTLADIVQADGPWPALAAGSAGVDICAAVAAVHAAGFLHRDVKAQNVVRDDSGRIVLMDFGAGTEIGSLPAVAGTPIYLAPEILSGGPASVASDIYSIGVLLFFLVTRRYPVEGGSIESLVAAHRAHARAVLTDLAPSIPARFARIVERALDPNPAKRFATAGEMQEALRGFVDRSAAARITWRAWSLVLLTAASVGGLVSTVINKGSAAQAGVAPATAIAVLPLAYESGAAQAPLVAEGLTDELITKLGQVKSLRVTAHTSVRQFASTSRPVSEIASLLHVGSVLEGSVGVDRSTPDPRVHVNLRLIRAGSDVQLWSNSFDRPLGNLVAIEAEIARAVTSSVHAALTREEAGRLQTPRATNAVAEQAYLDGRAHLAQFAARASEALEAFQRAIATDPEFAPARAGAARAYVALGFDRRIPQPDARASALAEVTKAIELQPDLAEAHATLADLKFQYDWDFDGAEREYKAALDLDPSASLAASQYAQFLAAMKRLPEAQALADESVARDPLSAPAELTRALVLYYSRNFSAALASAKHAETLDRGLSTTHFLEGRILEAAGDLTGALRETRLATAGSSAAVGWQVQALSLQALSGDVAGARLGFAALANSPAAEYLAASPHEAYFRLAVGEREAALRILDRAASERDPSLLWIDVDPRLDPIRREPAFTQLRSRIGLR
jgi:serine/threonine-protein kinase